MDLFRHRLLRLPVVLIGILAWLAISNHCALAALPGTAKAPMASCHSSPLNHSPARPDRERGMECCKVLRATLLKFSDKSVAFDALAFLSHNYVVGILPVTDEAHLTRIIEWDTGPPGLGSFVESVLQRSILAHAPPSLA